jgi:putative transposase
LLTFPTTGRSGAAGKRHALGVRMPHFYPKHLPDFPYVGKLSYALEFTTDGRALLFTKRAVIELVVQQFLRASRERGFVIVTYCLMPDHAHLVVDGQRNDSDCLEFIKAAKQYSGYYFKQAYRRRLWQRYGYERFIRDEMERALTIRYLLANPVKAGLVSDPRDYYGLGSERHTVEELMQMTEYSETDALD